MKRNDQDALGASGGLGPGPRRLRVLFVCLGNICRSPAAEIVCRAALEREGLTGAVEVDSCGTASYHVGQKPDARMLAALERAGYSYGGHRARVFRRDDFREFDVIVPQDESNREDLLALARTEEERQRVRLMSSWFADGEHEHEVPDPYYGGAAGFDAVIALLERSMPALIQELRERLAGRISF